MKTGVPTRSSGKLLYLLALVFFLYLQLLVSRGSTPPPFSPPSSLSLSLSLSHTHTHTHTGEEEAKHDPESYKRKESKVEDTVPPYQQLFRGWGTMWTPGWAVDRFFMNEWFPRFLLLQPGHRQPSPRPPLSPVCSEPGVPLFINALRPPRGLARKAAARLPGISERGGVILTEFAQP